MGQKMTVSTIREKVNGTKKEKKKEKREGKKTVETRKYIVQIRTHTAPGKDSTSRWLPEIKKEERQSKY